MELLMGISNIPSGKLTVGYWSKGPVEIVDLLSYKNADFPVRSVKVYQARYHGTMGAPTLPLSGLDQAARRRTVSLATTGDDRGMVRVALLEPQKSR